jgi:hypothetical protein
MNLPPKSGANNMEMRNVKVISIGANQNPVNFMDALALLFIGLKLTGHLDDWNWVEVLAPLWGPFMVMWFVRLVVSTFFDEEVDEEEE